MLESVLANSLYVQTDRQYLHLSFSVNSNYGAILNSVESSNYLFTMPRTSDGNWLIR